MRVPTVMTNSIQHVIESRTSVNAFLPDRPLAEGVIESLISQATKAPSAYNLQNWRFIAVRSPDAKARLESAAYGQRKIVDASVAFVICGTLEAYSQLASALRPSVDARTMEPRTVDGWVAQATATHEGNPVLQRDEAVRSASLAAMTLMLAAQGMGLGSCAMSGFDARQVSRAFGLDATDPTVNSPYRPNAGLRRSPALVRYWSMNTLRPAGVTLHIKPGMAVSRNSTACAWGCAASTGQQRGRRARFG
mgnify:FL=1